MARLAQYLGASRFFLHFFRRRPDRVRGIDLAENSGFSPEPFRRLAAALPLELRERIEFLFFPPDGFLPEKGKSCNEMRMIDMALSRSSLVRPGDLVLKLTGRYPPWSLGGDLADLAASAWTESFGGAWRTADNDKGRYFESIAREIVAANRGRPGCTPAFRRPPLVLAPPGHVKYVFGRAFPPALGRLHSAVSYLYLRAISPFAGD